MIADIEEFKRRNANTASGLMRNATATEIDEWNANTTKPLCIDCIWFNEQSEKCENEKAEITDPVFGRRAPFARYARSKTGHCSNGKLFEPMQKPKRRKTIIALAVLIGSFVGAISAIAFYKNHPLPKHYIWEQTYDRR